MDRLEVERATFLDLLSEPDRLELERRAGRRRFKRGATLMNEGSPGAEVMLLVAGRVKASVTNAADARSCSASRGRAIWSASWR